MGRASAARKAAKTRAKNRAAAMVSGRRNPMSLATSSARGILKSARKGRKRAKAQEKAGDQAALINNVARQAGNAAVKILKKKKGAIKAAMPRARKTPAVKAVIYVGNRKRATVSGKASSQAF